MDTAQHPAPLATAAPKYRADVQGNIAEIKRDCIALMQGEIRNAGHFLMEADDCESAMKEYADFLTAKELAACFKKALAA